MFKHRHKARTAAAAVLMILGVFATEARADRALVYKNATIETVGPNGRIETGNLVVRDGKIEAVGKDVAIPEDAQVIDAKGWTITPGLVEPYYIARTGGDAESTRTINIGGRTITIPVSSGDFNTRSFVRMAERFVPHQWKSPETVRVGLTSLNLTVVGYGQSAILRNDPKRREEMILQPEGFLFLSASDATSLETVRQGLRTAATAATKAAAPMGSAPASSGGTPAPESASKSLPLWQAVHDGKAPLVATTPTSASVAHLLRATETYPNVKLVLMASATAIQETFEELKERKVKVLIRPTIDVIPYSRERVNLPRKLNEAGIEFSFLWTVEVNDLRELQETPFLPLAFLVKTGLPRKVALESCTIRPATLLGMEKSIGSIETGKAANLLIFDGDPLEAQSRLRQVLVEGRTVHEK